MAITRTQIAKQLLAQGGRIGFFEGAQADASAGKGAMSPGTSTSGGARDVGGSDFGQFERRTRQNQALQGKGFLGKDLGMNIGEQDNLAKFGDFIKGGGFTGGIIRALGNLFTGPTRPPVTSVGGGGGGNIPYWAQLGYSSEAEYLAALARTSGETEQVAEGDSTEEKLFDDRFLRFRADGGPIGGEYDFESARQMYGLGKLVKKVTRTVKKIAKSPIGKAAIVGAGFGLAGMGPFKALQGSGFSKFLFGLPSGRDIIAPTKGLFGVGGKLALGKGKLGIGTLIAGTSLLAGLMTPKQEEEAQELARGEGIDIEAARRSILARAQGNIPGDLRMLSARANGGRIGYQEGSKEPVAKKTMPLLDMGGKEMDLREDGGFVPIGRMEKADDVPARLSKNEFVFTADAVRNAGDGDVDKGAEVMYNMMKNLEAGGDVSEESQGLEGARKMFQTSQRLEEVL